MAARTGYELRSLRFQNIRGFTDARVNLERENLVLVGPNNSGKTSVLRLLEWVFNGATETELRGEEVERATRDLLTPAREVGARARRITLEVFVPDGRHANRFLATDKIVSVRFRLWANRLSVRHGPVERAEPAESTELGIEFLNNLREQFDVLYIAASRTATEDGFKALLLQQMERRLRPKFQVGERGGNPSNDLKSLRTGATAVKRISESQLTLLWKDLDAWLPAALRSAGAFEVDVSVLDFAQLALEKSVGMLSTGDHDNRRVPIRNVGAGHQSLLWLGLALLREESERRRILLVEEPETFLHPSVQRQVARALFDASDMTAVVSTHSPVVVDESTAPEVMLVRDHEVYAIDSTDAARAEIHTALMSDAGAEAIFSSSVLLVEGPGDRAFFERLRRRLSNVIPAHVLGTMAVVGVGGSTRFGPWARLFRAYAGASPKPPIEWIVVADSCDAVSNVLEGLADGGARLSVALTSLARAIPQMTDSNSPEVSDVVGATRNFNAHAAASGASVRFLPVDLEYSMLNSAKPKTVKSLAEQFSITAADAPSLMARLGSKGGKGSRKDASKSDWQRDRIAREIPWLEVSPDVREILWAWVQGAATQLGAEVKRPKELESTLPPLQPLQVPAEPLSSGEERFEDDTVDVVLTEPSPATSASGGGDAQ